MICSSCGAPLNRDAQGALAACEYCGTSTVLPRAVAAVRAPDAGAALNADLEQVEAWWHRERQPFMSVDRRGIQRPPEEQPVGLIVAMALGMVLGLTSGVAGFTADSEWLGLAGFFLFPILITLPAALYHQRAEKRFKDYQRLEAEYQGRRNAIIDRHARKSERAG